MTAHKIFTQSMHSFLPHTPGTSCMSGAIHNQTRSVSSRVLAEGLGDINI